MNRYYLAVDIGASGGRHILGSMENGKICLEEVYRFSNSMDDIGGSLCWDTGRIFAEILCGMKKCKEIGKIPVSMSIDSWGVDYVLLDSHDRKTGEAVGYRDNRTKDMKRVVENVLSPEQIYERTGIPTNSYNTSCQLTALKKIDPEQLERAQTMLMTPDYYQFLLTGCKAQEYTMATTTQLVNASTGEWDYEWIQMLGLPLRIFQEIRQPGGRVGGLRPQVRKEAGFDCQVILSASHDTASAVLAIPGTKQDTLFISSGTWSIIGIESKMANTSEDARIAGFANEGSYGSGFYFAKNIMGLWMLQSVVKEYGEESNYDHICSFASQANIQSIVDCTDIAFLSPSCMTEAVQEACKRTGQQIPVTLSDMARVIYQSLATCYADTIKEIEILSGNTYQQIHVLGGGSKASYLNQLTEKYTGKKVIAGPAEATAVGNILVQMMEDKIFAGPEEARSCVTKSFVVKEE